MSQKNAKSTSSQQRAADLVFDGGHVPDESNVKVNKHRDTVEFTKSMPNFLQKMKEQALARRGLTLEQDLDNAKAIEKFTQQATVDDKRKHLESYETPTSAKAVAAAADQAQTDAEFEDEAFQRALRDMQQSSKSIQPTKANAAAAGATLGSAKPAVKRARTADDEKNDKTAAAATTTKSAQPSKKNTMALSFTVDDDDDD